MITKVKRGRPRGPGTDAAIVGAAAEVLSRRGYAGMTVAAVAALAGVTEPTVYLRYPTKRDLAMAAVTHVPLFADPPDTGDAFADLTALLSRFVTMTETSGLALTGVVLSEEHDQPELLERWRATVGTAFRAVVGRIVERGRSRGQLNEAMSAELVADLLIGAHLAHYTLRGRPARGWARRVTEALRPALQA